MSKKKKNSGLIDKKSLKKIIKQSKKKNKKKDYYYDYADCDDDYDISKYCDQLIQIRESVKNVKNSSLAFKSFDDLDHRLTAMTKQINEIAKLSIVMAAMLTDENYDCEDE